MLRCLCISKVLLVGALPVYLLGLVKEVMHGGWGISKSSIRRSLPFRTPMPDKMRHTIHPSGTP
ncbi:hypothetical protein IQ07DRAFT_585471 [Pyrenochaeta sp. DS3sAY3a]|nr:hypothetical protein IQ07DRAFT_585471 [Pyrenochaeta sp. DS3sAY3a]